MQSFTKRNGIIAGRYPNHGEAVDLIRLLIHQKCSILVLINPLFDVPYVRRFYTLLHYAFTTFTSFRNIKRHVLMCSYNITRLFQNWYLSNVISFISDFQCKKCKRKKIIVLDRSLAEYITNETGKNVSTIDKWNCYKVFLRFNHW